MGSSVVEGVAQSTPAPIGLMGLEIHPFREHELVEHVFARIEAGQGGSLLTANLDILRIFATEPAARRIYERSELCVADGMPLVWAARLLGHAIPERVAGSTLSETLISGCHARKLGVYLLGGTEGSAEAAAERMGQRHPGLEVLGDSSFMFSAEPTESQIDAAVERLGNLPHHLVLVGLGSPKQEAVIVALRERLPSSFMIGVGGTFSFLAGFTERAPGLLQAAGLEWLFRLSQEPKRLAHRYIVQDLPFFVTLMRHSLRRRGKVPTHERP